VDERAGPSECCPEENVSKLANSRKQIQFGVLTPEEMAELGELEIVRRELFQVSQDRAPIPFGCLDRRLVLFS
jgi:hypothetical protein